MYCFLNIEHAIDLKPFSHTWEQITASYYCAFYRSTNIARICQLIIFYAFDDQEPIDKIRK